MSRYENGSWTTYNAEHGVAEKTATVMIQDREGAIWVGTRGGGVSRYTKGEWSTFTTEDGLASDNVETMLQDRGGGIWVGTHRGVSLYKDNDWQTFSTEDGLAHVLISAIVQDQQDALWFGTWGGGISQYANGQWRSFTTEHGLADNRVRTILEGRKKELWVGTWGGVSLYREGKWTSFTREHGLLNNVVRAIYQDRNDVVWAGTTGGLSRYDEGVWTTFTTEDGLTHNFAISFLEDGEGNLWIGTYGGGVSCYNDRAFTTFTAEDGLVDSFVIPTFLDREGNLWAGTDQSGVSRYDGGTWTSFTEEDGLVFNAVRSIFQDSEGALWFGTHDGVSRYDPGSSPGQAAWTGFGVEDGMSGTSVYSIMQDKEGMIWFSTYSGVSRYDPDASSETAWTAFTVADGLVHKRVGSILQDKDGAFWFGTDGGVSRYDPGSGPGQAAWKSFTVEDGLAHNSVHAVFQDQDGVLWFGTREGLSRYDPSAPGTGAQKWDSFTTEDGLAHDSIWHSILEDREGILWIATEGGVTCYDGQTFQTLIRQDGLGSNSVFSILEDRRGNIWFGTNGGLTRFERPSSAPPRVSIESIVADKRYDGVDIVSIPSGAGLTAFEFAGYSFKTRPGGIVYRYRLSGHGDWKTTRDRRVEYQDLPRGDYVFEVEAVDRDLTYSESPATVTLTVTFYQRIGLMAGLGVAILLVAWQTVRVVARDRRLQASNQAMSDANRELFGLNQELQRDRAVERLRGQVQSMDRTEDFEGVLSLLTDDLKGVGLRFDTCEIDVLDEPVENPTMAYYEAHGLRYTTYTLNPDGRVSSDAFIVSAPFPGVVRQTVERFIAGEPWNGTSEGQTILEVPAGSYGRLRLVASDHDPFTDEETATLQEFAGAVALGYARYLDIRTIQENTQKKSAFLASMSHELRTPMNAIKGFTDLVLRRGKGELSERNQQNLTKVSQASDHLLAMINDLLDLSKIEAGRMDVGPTSFMVEDLVRSCCSTVSPLVKDGVALTVEVASDVGEAYTDDARVRQMLLNLLSNALKFTDEGSVTVKAEQLNGQIVIAVTDTGKGIPWDELPTIFDEYRQVKGSDQDHKGTGLGLSITKQFAELLGGSVGVKS